MTVRKEFKMNKNSVWLGELERFGYTLTVVGRTESETKDALAKEYIRAYIDANGCDPREDEDYFEVAMDEAYIREMPFGKVEWA